MFVIVGRVVVAGRSQVRVVVRVRCGQWSMRMHRSRCAMGLVVGVFVRMLVVVLVGMRVAMNPRTVAMRVLVHVLVRMHMFVRVRLDRGILGGHGFSNRGTGGSPRPAEPAGALSHACCRHRGRWQSSGPV